MLFSLNTDDINYANQQDLKCMYVCEGGGEWIAFSEICGIVCPAGKLPGPTGRKC